MIGQEEIVHSHESRVFQINIIIVFAFLLVIARLWYLQLYRGEIFLKFSIENRLREEVVLAPRGMIFDRNGELLVDNKPRFDVILIRQYLSQPEKTIKRLSEILEVTPEDINNTIKRYSSQARYRPIIIKKNITHKQMAMIETENDALPGISVNTFISREYTDNEIGAHLLGYISEINQDQIRRLRQRDGIHYRLGDFIGQFGIEQMFDKILRGKNGLEYVEVDALGRQKKYIESDQFFSGIQNVPSIPGNNMQLTIDRDLQKVAYDNLADNAGAFIAMDIESGEILTMVSTPSFRPGEFSRGITSNYWDEIRQNPLKPLGDRSVQFHYSPGSTFKVFTALAALQEKTIDTRSEISCNGRMKLGNRTYHCWKKYGHGNVNLNRAIRESCNIFFQKAVLSLSIDKIADVAKSFGLGTKTGIELPGEIPGLIPTEEWKMKLNGIPWQKGETLSCAIGQSYVLSTPIQLAVSYAALANGGNVLKPKLVKSIFDKDERPSNLMKPEVLIQTDINEEHLRAVKEGLSEVTNHPQGTAYWYRKLGVRVAGKTGTSQVKSAKAADVFKKCKELPYEDRHHALFVAYLPFNDPKVAMVSVIEHGCSGSSTASPLVSAVGEAYMKKYHPDLFQKYYDEDMKEYQRRIQIEKLRKEQQESEQGEDSL